MKCMTAFSLLFAITLKWLGMQINLILRILTIDAFANFVEGEQRLRFLYVHTFCDANATAPDLWNAHKEELHTQLFNNTLSVLEGKRARKDPSILKDAFKNLTIEGIPQEELVQHLDLVPVRYFSHAGKEDVSRHVEMVSLQTKQI